MLDQAEHKRQMATEVAIVFYLVFRLNAVNFHCDIASTYIGRSW